MSNTETLTLTGITRGHGMCACCGRTLGRVFQLSDGNEYGRKCAAKLTGFQVTDQAVRAAVMAARNAAAAAELCAYSELFAGKWGAGDRDAHPVAWDALIAYRDGRSDAEDAIEYMRELIATGVYADA
ncbi:hypothetical protein SEA_TINALIN_7 [Gordonia phage TinaLin]|uniref:Uncharacterized protein n=1 Tax=Gordonia phage TinaLin TaxID=2797324 RepID=A0A7T7GTG0_9CAUD|nr:hypothetical protein KDJ60_gp07 [Gordonia phage TinaLin]QQM15096.1 hypothetical protein SEA_TINALIN_7 [Gordonia phage TinaLin]